MPEMKRCYACDGKVHYYARKCPHCGQVFGDLDMRSTTDALPDANPKQLLLSTALVMVGFGCGAAAISKTWLLFIPAAGLFYAAYRINARSKPKPTRRQK